MKKILIAISITLISNASHAYCKSKQELIINNKAGRKQIVQGNSSCFGGREAGREWVVSQLTTERTKSLIAEALCADTEAGDSKTTMVYYNAWGPTGMFTTGELKHHQLMNVTVTCAGTTQAVGGSLNCPASVQAAALDAPNGFTAQRDGAGVVVQSFKSANVFENRLYCLYGAAGSYRVSKALPGRNCEVRGQNTAYCLNPR
jgi:hypothetical protein